MPSLFVHAFLFLNRYIAACAPHIQEFFHPPPPRGSYDYLRLTRNNHMPLPTWTYSQLLDDGWDSKVSLITYNICKGYTVLFFLCFRLVTRSLPIVNQIQMKHVSRPCL